MYDVTRQHDLDITQRLLQKPLRFAIVSDALIALLAGLVSEAALVVIVDTVEQGLDQPTQAALATYLAAAVPARGRCF